MKQIPSSVNTKDLHEIFSEKIKDLLALNQQVQLSDLNSAKMRSKFEERKKQFNSYKENLEEKEKIYYAKYNVNTSLIFKEFLSENSIILNGDNENNLNASQDDAQKGLLYKLLAVKEKLNKKIDLVNAAESELSSTEAIINKKMEKLSEEDKLAFEKLSIKLI